MPVLFGLRNCVINYTDQLTYFTLKTFVAEDELKTAPVSPEEIALRLDGSVDFVKCSLAKLKLMGLIAENSDNNELVYSFPALPTIDMQVPLGILNTELSAKEKAVLLGLKMYCLDNDTDISVSIIQFSKRHGVSCEDLFTLINSLIEKNYVRVNTDDNERLPYFQLCGRIDWQSANNAPLHQSFKMMSNEKSADEI